MRLPALFLFAAVVGLCTGCERTANPTSNRQPLLGSGRGVDHVTVLTNDVTKAAEEYATRLGFTVGPLTPYSFGFTGANIYFADGTYIELYGIHDREKVAAVGEGFAIEAPEGVRWVTLHTGSTAETATLLKQGGVPAWGPFTLPEDAPPGQWSHRLVGPEKPAFPGGRLYFVEYNDALRAKRRAEDPAAARAREVHANAALGLRSVWVGVRDLEAAAARYEAAGLIPGPVRRLDVLDTNAREIRTPGGTIILLQVRPPAESRDAQDAFAGISIKTESLERIQTLLHQSHPVGLRPYQGLYGRSILVPSALARGASIEFFE